MNEKAIKGLIQNLNLAARKAPRECLVKGCSKRSINSHILQKKGILSSISTRGHLVELATNPFKRKNLEFKPVGINDAFTFPGFCKQHDHKIFYPIESESVDYKEYHSQLLFSYRALLNEKRKKEIMVDFFDRVLGSFELKLFFDPNSTDRFRAGKQGMIAGIKDEEHYEKHFEKNLSNNKRRDFSFITRELPRIEVCSSAVFTYETTAELAPLYQSQDFRKELPFTEIYFNFLPTETNSILIIGCQSDRKSKCWDYIKQFEDLTDDKAIKQISNVLLCQVENWLCSKAFYNQSIEPFKNEIIDIVTMEHSDERRDLEFNMFNK